MSRIQAFILGNRGLPVGNYSFYATRLESLFRAPVVGALDEYGIPPSIGEALVPVLGVDVDLDEALVRLRALDLSQLTMSTFELDLLSRVVPSL